MRMDWAERNSQHIEPREIELFYKYGLYLEEGVYGGENGEGRAM